MKIKFSKEEYFIYNKINNNYFNPTDKIRITTFNLAPPKK